MNRNLKKAIRLLKEQCGVNALEYAVYRNGYIFKTDSKGMINLFVVDMDVEISGPFSLALDMDGFLKIANDFKKIS